MKKEQLELFVRRQLKVTEDDTKKLVDLLASTKKWMFAYEICHYLDWSKRKVRAVANASDGDSCILSGPSSQGYKLLRLATKEEVEATCGALHHQINEQIARLTRMTRNYHKLFNMEDKQNG